MSTPFKISLDGPLWSGDAKIQKENSWHIKVQGAYVQEPIPAIVGLEDNEAASSNDATALYPTSTVFSNISVETLYGKLYDHKSVVNFINLLKKSFALKKEKGLDFTLNQVIPSFRAALDKILKIYFQNNSVKNKTEARDFTLEYYPNLLARLIAYYGELEDIFEPTDDETYILLRSYFLPLIETVAWLSPHNKKYSQTMIDYIFFEDVFYNEYADKEFYLIEEYNNVGLKFKILSLDEIEEKYFLRFLLNPYGTLFYTHQEKLAFEVELIIEALKDRRKIKNSMLALDAINSNYNLIAEYFDELFLSEKSDGIEYFSESQIREIFTLIGDTDNIDKRIESLINVFLEKKTFTTREQIKKYFSNYQDKLDGFQNGIKVTLNSGYGIMAMISFGYSDPNAGNSITTGGKIFGTKMFQAVSVYAKDKFEARLPELEGNANDPWRDDDWVDLELADEVR